MSEAAAVLPHLKRRFDQQRVVFWHDPGEEYDDAVELLTLDGVLTVRVGNDEYAVKHRLLRLESDAKFLVYRSGVVPTGIDNWLLDLELAYGVFTADQTSLIRGARPRRRWRRRRRSREPKVLPSHETRREISKRFSTRATTLDYSRRTCALCSSARRSTAFKSCTLQRRPQTPAVLQQISPARRPRPRPLLLEGSSIDLRL